MVSGQGQPPPHWGGGCQNVNSLAWLDANNWKARRPRHQKNTQREPWSKVTLKVGLPSAENIAVHCVCDKINRRLIVFALNWNNTATHDHNVVLMASVGTSVTRRQRHTHTDTHTYRDTYTQTSNDTLPTSQLHVCTSRCHLDRAENSFEIASETRPASQQYRTAQTNTDPQTIYTHMQTSIIFPIYTTGSNFTVERSFMRYWHS